MQVVELNDVHVLLILILQIHKPGIAFVEPTFKYDFMREFGDTFITYEDTSFSKIVFNAQTLQICVYFIGLSEETGLEWRRGELEVEVMLVIGNAEI